MSMLSERELNPPEYKRESTLGTIEEGEEKADELENGGENIDSVVEEGEKKTNSHIMNGLYNPTSSALSNGNGSIKSEKEETAV